MIGDFFAPGGALQEGLSSYESRPEQKRMASAVASAFADGASLLVEAGTGTGKSLAYLIPALSSNLRVIVSTATRSLQDQLLSKDLPLLRQVLKEPFEAVPLKGTSNYLCKRKLSARSMLGGDDSHWLALKEWAYRTETGDRADLISIPEDAAIWAEVTTTPESRLASRCPHYEQCFVTKARRRAEEADLVIVNHHLFFADLALRKEHPGAHVLPDYEAVIFDEAHGLEETMTEHFGVNISTQRIEHLLRDWRNHIAGDPRQAENPWMPKRGQRLADETAVRSAEFFAAIRRKLIPLAQASDGERFTLPDDLVDEHTEPMWHALDTALEELYANGVRGAELLRDDEHEEKSEELKILAGRCARFRNDLASIADRKVGRGDYVFWGRLRGQSISLHASPVAVKHVLQEELLSKGSSLVLTSATLSAGGGFSHLRSRLGLEADTTDELLVDSPFDYQKQCLLYLPRDIPDPRNAADMALRHERIAKLVDITRGHALLLFTSYRAMHQCHEALKKTIPYPLFVQGQAPRNALLEEFRETPGAVLLATSSFWEGIDIPGKALTHVLIDKLPFDVPSDPLNEARMNKLEAEGISAFENYQLPRAAIALKQGFGRLIRHKTDRGIVSILDPRIVTRRYGRFFLDSLPSSSRTSNLEQTRRWWQNNGT
ncbi:MAG: ATP-dependent DNA helicase [Kofleriaceae bacterium]|nr:ATP-dependent DNA helicase [Kofleriaceae bacterium]